MGNKEDISARIVAIDQETLDAKEMLKKHQEEMKQERKKKKPNSEEISRLKLAIGWQKHQIEVLGNEREDLNRRLTRREPTATEIIAAIRNAEEKTRKKMSKGKPRFIG